VLFAGTAGAGIVTANLGCRANVLFDRRMVVMAVIAVRAVDMAGGVMLVVMIVVMVAVGAMDVRGGGLECVGHWSLRQDLGRLVGV
jgi:hypothetical protein